MNRIIILSLFLLTRPCLLTAFAQSEDNANAAREWHMNDPAPVNDGWTDDGWSDMQDAMEAGTQGIEQLNQFMNIYSSARDLYDAMQTLDRGECTPDFTVDSRAVMPSTCQGNQECTSCFQDALAKINFVRQGLGRMRCIWINTKALTDYAVSFGDNVAGLHGAMGLVWQNERAGIIGSYNHFKQTYDRKYTDFMGSLNSALMEMDACERQFGMPDWYQRFGYMFLEIMKEKYKRTD